MPQRTKLFAIALLLGVVAASLAYVYLTRKAADRNREVRVVIARRQIPSGTVMESNMVEMRMVRVTELPPQTLLDPNMVVGKVAVLDIRARQPIAMTDLSQRYRLAHIVEPLMRAVSVAIDPITGVAGFLKPGDHVDVISTFNVNGGTVTKTILQDVKLIAIGPNVVAEPDTPAPDAGQPAKAVPQTNATLSVSPMDAERLVLAANKGRICLALRRPDDTSYVSPRGTTSRGMIGTVPPDVPKETTRPAPAPAPARSSFRPLASTAGMMPPLPMSVGPLPAVAAAPKPAPSPTIQVIRGTDIKETQVSP